MFIGVKVMLQGSSHSSPYSACPYLLFPNSELNSADVLMTSRYRYCHVALLSGLHPQLCHLQQKSCFPLL